MSEKTHYRKVFKSDHLGVADLEEFLEEGRKLVFTIKYVKQEYQAQVAGKKIDANIAYFKEDVKPLVLNATNSKTLKGLAKSSFVEDWENISIQLEIDASVKMKGQVVGGVRISEAPVPPRPKPTLTRENPKWESIKNKAQAENLSAEYFEEWFSIPGDLKKEINQLNA